MKLQNADVKMQRMAAPFRYVGGKGSIADLIVRGFPEHRVYVEPFAGSCSVIFAKPRSVVEVVNDLDGDLMVFWRVLRDRPEELIRACELTPESRAEYALCAKRPPWLDELERARRTWVMLVQGFKPVTKNSGWRIETRWPKQQVETAKERLRAAAERIASVVLECADARDVVDRYGSDPEALLYVDPPYHDSHQGSYRHRMDSEQAQRDLAKRLHQCAAAVVLSGQPSDLYDRELYADWHRADLGEVGRRWNLSAAKRNAPRREVLWSNRPLASAGQDEGEGNLAFDIGSTEERAGR